MAQKNPRITELRVSALGTRCASTPLGHDQNGGYFVSLFKQPGAKTNTTPVFKLGKYKWDDTGQRVDFQSPSALRPTSRVILTPEQTDLLIEFLRTNFPALKAGVSEFIDVSQYKGDLKSVLNLVLEKQRAGLVPEDFALAIRMQERRQAVEEMRQRIGETHDEPDWQQWLRARDWIIGGSMAVTLSARDIDLENQADYLLQAEDGHLDIVEIKRPDTPFWKKRQDHKNWVPATAVVEAITQGYEYAYRMDKKADSKDEQERLKAPVARPNVLVVASRSDTWGVDKFEAQRLLNATLHGVRVITYDQLLLRAEKLLPVAAEADAQE